MQQQQPDAAATFEIALQDTTPLNVADIMAAALTAADANSSSSSSSSVLYLPSMVSAGLSSGAAADGSRFSYSSSTRGVACQPVPLRLRLIAVTGWGEADPRFASPLVQRRVAQWLRHKLAAAPGSSWGAHLAASQQQQHPGRQLVPLDGPVDANAQHQQQQARTWAGVVRGGQVGNGTEGPSTPPQQQALVLRVASGVEVLSSSTASLPGPGYRAVCVELADVAPSALDNSSTGSSSNGNGGWGGSNGNTSSSGGSVLRGACGVLLLVSGADAREVQGAVKRLGLLLEAWPPAVPVPLTLLACSGERGGGSVLKCGDGEHPKRREVLNRGTEREGSTERVTLKEREARRGGAEGSSSGPATHHNGCCPLQPATPC
jgi:hypothetical protein